MKIKNNFLFTNLLKLLSQFDKKFLKNFHVLDKVYFSILTLITITLSLANFTPNTILSGWDTLHPEFNFPLAISRSLSSAYQEHQGLGAVSAQSHLGDLPRILFLNLVSVVVPVESIRYFYIFLMLVLGPLGVYFFLKELFSQVSEKADYRTPAFMGALFYLCNLSVVQHFVVPLEMFVTLFGLLGFLFQAIYLNLRSQIFI